MILCNKNFHVAVLGILVPCQHGDWLSMVCCCLGDSFGSAVFYCPCYFLLSWPVVGVLFPCPFRYYLCRGLLLVCCLGWRGLKTFCSCWYVVTKKKKL